MKIEERMFIIVLDIKCEMLCTCFEPVVCYICMQILNQPHIGFGVSTLVADSNLKCVYLK